MNLIDKNSSSFIEASITTAAPSVERIAAILGIAPDRAAVFAATVEWRREYGGYLALMWRPSSSAAIKFIDQLVKAITPTGCRYTKQKSEAAGAIVGDLLAIIAADADGYGYRSFGSKAFQGHWINRQSAKAMVDQMEAAGLLEVKTGDRAPPRKGYKARSTAIKPTRSLIDKLAERGITPGNASDHFADVFEPIVLRGKSGRERKWNGAPGDRIVGKKMRVDTTNARVIRSARIINEVNTVFNGAVFDFGDVDIPQPRLQRVYNNGDVKGFDYNFGGRSYAPFQSMKQSERSKITIVGEQTCEIDISSSHYTIAMVKLGYAFDPSADYYSVPGFPRIIVKRYVNSCVGQGKPIYGWPEDLVKEYALPDTKAKPNRFPSEIRDAGFTYTGDLRRDFPIRTLKERVLPLFPALERLQSLALDWAPLSFIESEAVIGAVHELCTVHGIPCLPVHDSIIAPVSKADIVAEALSRHFENVVGTKPKLSRK